MGPVFLVIGPPATGKSTASRGLATQFHRGVHLEVDALRASVVSGCELPAPDWSPALVEQIRLAREGAVAMARAYAAAGFAVVIDDFWDPNGLLEYRALIDAGEVHPVLLIPSEEAARRRNIARSGTGEAGANIDAAIGHSYGMLERVVERLGREGWLVLDTTDLDVEATIATILGATGHASEVRAPSDGRELLMRPGTG